MLLKIADVLNCDAGDMMSFVKDDSPILPEIDDDDESA